ncbi:MAG: carbamoyl-phosphate synthase small subunit, partial [Neisseriaceae bacterium]|nr:carbamoyl-phosphate synthase small subunit [Neisseriaceae bacterium]
MTTPAVLVLADGSTFHGVSIGADGETVGEVVFNTSMTGYQEILTDPSYCYQMVTLTYPHIGNTGCNTEDNESRQVYAAGLIIRDLPLKNSNFRSEEPLSDYLKRHNIVAIADIDTRRLTHILRHTGSQAGCIITGENADIAAAQNKAIAFGSMAGKDLAQVVTRAKQEQWTQGEWRLGQGFSDLKRLPYKVVAYDFG